MGLAINLIGTNLRARLKWWLCICRANPSSVQHLRMIQSLLRRNTQEGYSCHSHNLNCPTSSSSLRLAARANSERCKRNKPSRKELYERFAIVIDHFSKVGSNLNKAVESYNEAVRSTEIRLIPSFRRFRELGISSTKEVDGVMDEISQTAKEAKHITLE